MKNITILIGICIILFITSCDNNLNQNATKEPSQTNTITASPNVTATPEPTPKEYITFSNLEGRYYPFQDIIVKTDFPGVLEETAHKNNFEFSGQHTLYQDRMSEIKVTAAGTEGNVQISITIDGQDKTFEAGGLDGLDIVDLDEKDDFKEIAIYYLTQGLEGRILFIRFYEEIFDMGDIFSGDIRNSLMVIDKDTMRLTRNKGPILQFLDPPICLDYIELKGNLLHDVELDINSVINKEYTVIEEIAGSHDEQPRLTFEEIDLDNPYILRVGQKIKLLRVDGGGGENLIFKSSEGKHIRFTTVLAG